MSEPWFDAARFAWMPGTIYGVSVGLLGALTGILLPRGKAKTLVIGLASLFLALAIFFLTLGVVALLKGQPYGVWYALLLPGFIGLMVVGCNFPMLIIGYRQAERRKMQARDMLS